MGRVIGGRVGGRMEQVTIPTTDPPKPRLFSGKASQRVTTQVTTEDKRRLIAEVWGAPDPPREDFGEWVWHGTNTSVEGVREGLTRIITDELAFCNRPGLDPMTPELPDRHDYALWAHYLLDAGYGEVPEEVVTAALTRVGYNGQFSRPTASTQRSER